MITNDDFLRASGVMLSHRNLISAMSSLINIAQFKPNDRYIGYLPLAHVLELLAETSCLLYGIKVGYRYVIVSCFINTCMLNPRVFMKYCRYINN